MVRTLTILLVVAAMSASLAACGRKGKLVVPEGSTYPRTYPDITFPETTRGPEDDRVPPENP